MGLIKIYSFYAEGAFDYEQSGFGAIHREEDGVLVDSKIIDPQNPPPMPRDLREVFGELDNRDIRARIVTYKDKNQKNAQATSNGWSMCQGNAPVHARKDENAPRQYLVPL